MKHEAIEAARLSLEIEAAAVKDILGYLDEGAFARAVGAIIHSGHTITCASGSSGIAAKKFAHSLCCIERPASFLSPAEAVHGGLGRVQPGNAVIMVSRGGKTAELLPIIDVCNRKKATLIAVTENLSSPLAQHADIVVPMKIERESDPCNIMATASFIATIALFDALLCAIMVETDYRIEQFALIHPGGAVGAQLNKG